MMVHRKAGRTLNNLGLRFHSPSQSAPTILVLKIWVNKSGPFFGPDFFQVPDHKKISGQPDKLE